jgi:twitching motility protein PilT
LDSGNESGTFAFNRDLLRLVRAGKISKSDALRFSSNPQQLDMNLKGIFIKV